MGVWILLCNRRRRGRDSILACDTVSSFSYRNPPLVYSIIAAWLFATTCTYRSVTPVLQNRNHKLSENLQENPGDLTFFPLVSCLHQILGMCWKTSSFLRWNCEFNSLVERHRNIPQSCATSCALCRRATPIPRLRTCGATQTFDR
jgi:hypothetical protein